MMSAISLCMIVKDEEANLKKTLQSVCDYIDEIIIIDTGSKDKTKEISKQYTDKIYDYAWNNSFSDARNYSISKASNEYILVLDADEVVDEFDMEQIKSLISANPEKVGRLLRVNEYERNGMPYRQMERVNRLFSKKLYCYDGIIHEQVISKEGSEKKYDTYLLPLKIIHSGYEGDLETRKKKTERNIELLKEAQKENPQDPYIIYQLGKSYYMAEDYVQACSYFDKALYFDLDTRLEYVQNMVESYGYALMNCKEHERALQLISVYDEFKGSADFVFMIALALMNNGRFQEAIEEFLKAAEKTSCKMEGVNSYMAFYNIGVIYECMGNFENAYVYYVKCGDYEPAKERLRQMKQVKL
ncbi:glycosyltransferase [Konateibacter massiliensis]|uniref:glycosyltransferase n=1 Tax=Konateibacter massiliensis TaxID=2002841 RepID=UPI001F44E234|nr:glycosyltransferase [Konateibacter massiliensis]